MMKKEPGFTLLETLIATAVTGLIISLLGTAVYQTITVAEYGNDRMVATHEVQNIAHWVSLDGQMAANATGGTGLVLTLTDDSSITYDLAGTDLRRTADGSQMTLARNITGANFTVESRSITITITSSPDGNSETSEQGTYKVYLRPTGG